MTRINVVKPQYLLDQHLISEYRELPMVAAALRRSLQSISGLNVKSISPKYTLNTGHVKFFYLRGEFLEHRWDALIQELQRRGVNINPDARNVDFAVFDILQAVQWQPTKADVQINVERILQRVRDKPNWYRYKNKPVTYSWYRERLLAKLGA